MIMPGLSCGAQTERISLRIQERFLEKLRFGLSLEKRVKCGQGEVRRRHLREREGTEQ